MQHTNNFDGVRLLAAFAVLVSHQFWLIGQVQPTLAGSMTLGGTAVLVFFAISGFLVASSWTADPVAWRFVARRLLRIWPAYAAVVVIMAMWLAIADAREITPFASWVYAWKNLAFVNFDWPFFPTHHDGRLNASLWTVAYEVSFYAALAVLVVLLRRHWPVLIGVFGGAAFAWWSRGLAAVDPSALVGVDIALLFGAYFLFGAVLFGLPALRTNRATLGLLAIGAITFLLGVPVIGLLILISTATIFVGSRAWPGLRGAGRFGDLSYGVYLWGWPLQQEVVSALGPGATFGTAMAASVAVVTLAAALSWHLVEKHALRAKPSRLTPWPERLKLQKG